ncbi:hypothetical protein ACQKIC_01660 [Peribacillus sp. NPDC046944]
MLDTIFLILIVDVQIKTNSVMKNGASAAAASGSPLVFTIGT